MRFQKTIQQPVIFRGIGIHTGKMVEMKWFPAPAGTGRVFIRQDVSGYPSIVARADRVVDTVRSTTIADDSGNEVKTVEHVLAALYAYHIDNIHMEISAGEMPIGDGSSLPFVEMIQEAGILQQELVVRSWSVEEPFMLGDERGSIEGFPYSGFKVSYHLHYPYPKILQQQFYEADISAELFFKEIAPCRTFASYQELEHLMDRGLIRGGSLSNAVVIMGESVLSKGGLRFANEMARHKVLDFLGDMSLAGLDLRGHFVLRKSGHSLNTSCAAMLLQKWSAVPLFSSCS